MKTDVYTKTVLTVIACCLVYIVGRDIRLVDNSYAQTGATVDINITQIGGKRIEGIDLMGGSYGPSLPVKVFK